MTKPAHAIVTFNDGAAMPQFGLGVFQTPPDATERIVKMAVDDGYRLVDTASMYRNEDGVCKALVGRTEVFVTTKFFPGSRDPVREIEASLQRLQLEYVDLYWVVMPVFYKNGPQIHWLDFATLAATLSLCGLVFWGGFKKNKMVPVGDLRFEQSLHFENA